MLRDNQSPKTKIMPKETEIMPNNKTLLMREYETVSQPAQYVHIGQVLNNKYSLSRVISDNTGEAALFLAEYDEETYVAKVYHENKKPNTDVMNVTRRISSPFVFRVLDEGMIGNRYFEIQPYYYQGDLLMATPLDAEEMINTVVPSVNEALKAIHDQGIIHRDIKPDNLFYSFDRKSVIIGDFGISSILRGGLTVRPTNLSRTPDYAAPETIQGFVSRESDYYSLGITIFHLLIGMTPFTGMNELQITQSKLTEKLVIPNSLDRRIAHLIKGLTVKERKDRWGYEEINRWLMGEHVLINENTSVVTNNPYHFGGETYHSLNDLAVAIGQNWDEGIKHLKRGFLIDYAKNIRQDLTSNLMDCEEESDHDIAIFKTIYSLHSEAPLCWQGEVFEDLPQLGKRLQHRKEQYLELLQKGLLLYFLKVRKADSALIKEVERLQELSKMEENLALFQLSFLLNPDLVYQMNGFEFEDVDSLVQYLYEHQETIDDLSTYLVNDPFFLAWLDHLGYRDHIREWKQIQYE